MIKIGVLTSSRADYSIYTPLLSKVRAETDWSLEILAFGAHLSDQYGCTMREIEKDGFAIKHALNTMPTDDSPGGIARSMAATLAGFATIWESGSYDLILALGDRFEMFAAVASTLPFNLKVAHIAGGETTLGAIDNAFRHSITHMSCIHFTTTDGYRRRVVELIGHDRGVFNTGSLSVDTLSRTPWLSRDAFLSRWGIDLNDQYILITVHPETVSFERNGDYMKEVATALRHISGYRLVVTMPNADTNGTTIREQWNAFAKENPAVILVESFGTAGYLTAMKHASLMLGNTSSGFTEAEYFPKPVVNLGERQRGRIVTPNIINSPFIAAEIVSAIQKASSMSNLMRSGIYGDGSAADKMIGHITAFITEKRKSANSLS